MTEVGSAALTPFEKQVEARFGVLPNFFRTANAAPGLIEELWRFAKSAYLDNPLPSIFKERLFVYLSQFCPVRYCIVRHVGFLVGLGRPAGDANAEPERVQDVVALLQRPRPDLATFEQAISRLLARNTGADIPPPDDQFEQDLFDVLTLLFLTPLATLRAKEAIRKAIGDTNFEYVAAFLVFIRAAHYWTETHPEIEYEADALRMLENHEELARLLLQRPQSVAR